MQRTLGTIAATGKGAPDYSNTVSSAHQRAGIYLQYPQRLKMYGRSLNLGGDIEYPFVPSTPLAVGANTHLTDFETLMPLPTIVPVGYTLSMAAIGYTFSQDCQVYSYIDGGIHLECLAAVEGGIPIYENRVIGLSTSWLDPLALLPHQFDIKLYNVSGAPLFGSVAVTAVLEAVGTEPLPTTKVCRCPYCEHDQTESVHATRITCKNCGRIYIVYDFSSFTRTP